MTTYEHDARRAARDPDPVSSCSGAETRDPDPVSSCSGAIIGTTEDGEALYSTNLLRFRGIVYAGVKCAPWGLPRFALSIFDTTTGYMHAFLIDRLEDTRVYDSEDIDEALDALRAFLLPGQPSDAIEALRATLHGQ